MFRNYFISAWRNLAKNKLNAIVNVTGLTVAFTCCILLSLTIYYEFSFDSFQKNAASIYKVYNITYQPGGDETTGTLSFPAAPAIKAEVPGVVKSTGILGGGRGIRYKEKELDKNTTLVDNDFFSMFSFPVIAGNASSPLGSLNSVVLTKTIATALFGSENPIGKAAEVKIGSNWQSLTVSAVVADAPDNSTIRFDVLARMELHPGYAEHKNDWFTANHPVYVQLAPNATQQQAEHSLRNIVSKYSLVDINRLKAEGYRKDANGDMAAYKLASLTNLHFNQEVGAAFTVSKSYLYTLMLIAIIVMVIACFNFINLNVARAFTRAREVGVRKTIGAGKKQIFIQLWVESLLLCVIALVVAAFVSSMLLEPFNSLFTEKLKLATLMQPGIIACVIAGMLFVSFLAGGYPAAVVAKFKVVEVLKGKVSVGRSVYLRNGLITFQFVMASLLICSTTVIYRQFEHLRNAPLGFEQENVISIPIKNADNSTQYLRKLRAMMATQQQVESITASGTNFGIGEDGNRSSTSMGFGYKTKNINTVLLNVDYDFLKTTGIKPIAGRDFTSSYGPDTAGGYNDVIMTESAAKQYGEQNLVGLTMTDTSAPRWRVVGIAPDFHLFSMQQKIQPVTFLLNPGGNFSFILAKVKTANPAATMAMIKTAYKNIEPGNITNPSYLNENTQRWYDKEQRLSTIFFASAGIAVLLSCLGLFAIVNLVMEQRRKEVGVRKVLGASVTEITALLSKDFIKLVALAFLIATPVAWYFLNQWLQNFSYRVNVSWWIFPMAGAAILLIALITVSFQTIKASLANPVKSLRSE